MKYAIITNPASGILDVKGKMLALAQAAKILDSEIYGLKTKTSKDFQKCAVELSKYYDVLVVAGGDGSFSDIINAIDTNKTIVAYLPLGSGNALSYALSYKNRRNLVNIATQIKKGLIHNYDLILCNNTKKCYFSSLGIDGEIIRIRNKYLTRGIKGFRAYLFATISALQREYHRIQVKGEMDESTFKFKNLLNLMVVKQPYYGFSMKIVPKAKFNDGQLHLLFINSSLLWALLGAGCSFITHNPVGKYHQSQTLSIKTDRPVSLQLDGNYAWKSNHFTFKILPGTLKIKF